MINVSELIEDPDFCQPKGIQITRTKTQIINHRPSKVTTNMVVQGIITISKENEDELLEEADRNSEHIHIFTYNRLKSVGKDKLDGQSYEADIVKFNGSNYKVVSCMDDTQYGFCRSTAVKIEQDIM